MRTRMQMGDTLECQTTTWCTLRQKLMQRNPLTGLSRELDRARASRRSRRNTQQLSSSTYSERMTNAMQTTTAQAEMCRMMAHYIRVATRRVDDTLFMQLRMWMGIFRPRPLQLRTQPRRATPIVLDQSLVQSTTTDIRDEKSAEDDDEDELITVRSPQKPSPRYRAERNRELIGKR